MKQINTAPLSRREVLAGTLATVASAGRFDDSKVQAKGSPFVLVHGARCLVLATSRRSAECEGALCCRTDALRCL